jgi:hypothetical protein
MRHEHRTPAQVLRELRLPRAERRAAKAERAVEARMRAERDDPLISQRLAARNAAEARRHMNMPWGP